MESLQLSVGMLFAIIFSVCRKTAILAPPIFNPRDAAENRDDQIDSLPEQLQRVAKSVS